MGLGRAPVGLAGTRFVAGLGARPELGARPPFWVVAAMYGGPTGRAGIGARDEAPGGAGQSPEVSAADAQCGNLPTGYSTAFGSPSRPFNKVCKTEFQRLNRPNAPNPQPRKGPRPHPTPPSTHQKNKVCPARQRREKYPHKRKKERPTLSPPSTLPSAHQKKKTPPNPPEEEKENPPNPPEKNFFGKEEKFLKFF